MKRKSFEHWMAEVNSHVESLCGMSANDLPDCCYRDWYDDEVSPRQAANRAVKNAAE